MALGDDPMISVDFEVFGHVQGEYHREWRCAVFRCFVLCCVVLCCVVLCCVVLCCDGYGSVCEITERDRCS